VAATVQHDIGLKRKRSGNTTSGCPNHRSTGAHFLKEAEKNAAAPTWLQREPVHAGLAVLAGERGPQRQGVTRAHPTAHLRKHLPSTSQGHAQTRTQTVWVGNTQCVQRRHEFDEHIRAIWATADDAWDLSGNKKAAGTPPT
jgi:hypothetical protein